MLGYGTGTAWYKQGDESKLDQACIDSTKTAIKLEYYHLDGAEVYKTETELGTAIKESGVPREKLFVTTKVILNISDIRSAIDTSLKKLQMDYVDLYVPGELIQLCVTDHVQLPHPRAILRQRRQRREATSGSLGCNGGCESVRQGQVNRRLKLPSAAPRSNHEDRQSQASRQPNRVPPLPTAQ